MSSTFSLKQKNILITGGCSGIGAAIAEKFLIHGGRIFILDKTIPESISFMKTQEFKDRVEVIECDITHAETVQKIVNSIEKRMQLDILVNNAGIAHVGTLESTSENDFDNVYQVNIKGVYNCSKSVIPYMKERGKGVILNMASIAGELGISDRFAYSMSKGAVLSMTLSIAKDYISYGIRCNSISPARVHTPFVDAFIKKNYPGKEQEKFEELSKTQPIGRMGEPEEVAHLALYLCSDEASFITGINFPIDGGYIKLNG